MTTCAVKWCCAGAREGGDKCAVHAKLPEFKPSKGPGLPKDADADLSKA